LRQKIDAKLADKTTTASQAKNVLGITTREWSIEASALMRSKIAKTQKNAAKVTNAAAELAAKKNITNNLPNYHAFLTWDVGIWVLGNFAARVRMARKTSAATRIRTHHLQQQHIL
jgi:hypothetical protein